MDKYPERFPKFRYAMHSQGSRVMNTKSILKSGLLLAVLASMNAYANTCSYQYYAWNTVSKTASEFTHVSKSYSELAGFERDAQTGCTVCEEDQVLLAIPPLKAFKMCHIVAPRVAKILHSLVAAGEPLISVTGYRVGKTKGSVDNAGHRTEFSNHSFGIALDIKNGYNGLYDNCIEYSEHCTLVRGGAWHPDQPQSLTAESVIVRALQSVNFKWGGQILGYQKDFMHFSPSGY